MGIHWTNAVNHSGKMAHVTNIQKKMHGSNYVQIKFDHAFWISTFLCELKIHAADFENCIR